MYNRSYDYFVVQIKSELFKRVECQPLSTCFDIFNILDIATNHNFIGAAKALFSED